MMVFSACGGGTSGGSQQSAALSGNWQFTLENPPDNSFQGYNPNPSDPNSKPGSILQGGFILQQNGSVAGQTVYSIYLPPAQSGGGQTLCSGGTATLTAATLTGQTVSLTFVAGSPSNNITFNLSGTLGSDGSIGVNTPATYSTTVMPAGSTTCGTAQTGLSWSAVSVPSLTGSVTGSFHSGGTGDDSGMVNQDFPVTGSLVQGANIGASSATVTGTLSFIDPTTGLSDYPCFPGGTVPVRGQITGNTVILHFIGTDGSSDGQIGIAASEIGTPASYGDDLQLVTFDSAGSSATSGYVLHSTGQGYQVITKACPAKPNSSPPIPQELGYICLALNGTTACQEPVMLSPAVVTFPAQILNASQRQRQVVTLTNNSGSSLSGLTLSFAYDSTGSPFGGYTDFNGLPSFQAEDTCAEGGESFALLRVRRAIRSECRSVLHHRGEFCPAGRLPLVSVFCIRKLAHCRDRAGKLSRFPDRHADGSESVPEYGPRYDFSRADHGYCA